MYSKTLPFCLKNFDDYIRWHTSFLFCVKLQIKQAMLKNDKAWWISATSDSQTLGKWCLLFILQDYIVLTTVFSLPLILLFYIFLMSYCMVRNKAHLLHMRGLEENNNIWLQVCYMAIYKTIHVYYLYKSRESLTKLRD